MLKIMIDPGHTYGENVGACNGYREGTAMYYLAQELAAALGAYEDVETVLTRTLTEAPTVDARGQMAARSGCGVFLSLHSDASGSAGRRGVTVIRSLRRPESAALGRALAEAVDGVLSCGKSPYAGSSGGVWTRPYPGRSNLDYYGVIRGAAANAAVKYAFLIEHSFHTSPVDCAQLDGSAVRRRIAQAEAEALAQYFGLAAKSGTEGVQRPQETAGKPSISAVTGAQKAVTRRYPGLSRGDIAQMAELAGSLGVPVCGDLSIGPASAGDDQQLRALADRLTLRYEEV